MTQQRLEFPKKNLSVVEVSPDDARRFGPPLRALRDLVLANEEMYPGIQRWFDRKVIPGLQSTERTAFVGVLDDRPVVSAIVKRGARSKFCHLRIGSELQDQHLGELFFTLMTLRVRSIAKEVHFTLPEGLWEERRKFFSSFGFSGRQEAETQYRLFEPELRCSARFADVWRAALLKIPKLVSTFSAEGYALDSSLLLSLKPRWANAILSGRKTVEVRRVFSHKWEGHRASIYATHPVKSLVGEVRVARVVAADPRTVWMRYGDAIGCDRESFDEYAGTASRIFALELADVRPFAKVVGLSELSELLGEKPRVPQSYVSVVNTSVWGRCVSLAALLNGTGLPGFSDASTSIAG